MSIRHLLRRALAHGGLELRRINSRASMTGTLDQARRMGFSPAAVIDVGAAYGEFTSDCQKVFPQAQYVLIEPLSEYSANLATLASSKTNVHVVPAAAAASDGEITINVHRDLVGSSLYQENEVPSVDGSPRNVTAVTLDSVCQQYVLAGRILLKLDVQGAELDVLRGASQTLQRSDYILMEVCLFRYFKGGADLGEVVAFMKHRGFVPYDVFNPIYRPLDNALSQVDMTFVREDGLFRQQHQFALPHQREELNKRLIAARENKLPR